jgi:hypothetical protein
MFIVILICICQLNSLKHIRIQALEWVQGKIQDLILNNVTTDYPFYDDE